MPSAVAESKKITSSQRAELQSSFLNELKARSLTQNGIAAKGAFFETIMNTKTTGDLIDGILDSQASYSSRSLSNTDKINFDRAFAAVTSKLNLGPKL